eukprot:6211391-Pleurochrysis_carterae.AAC.4
MLLHNALNEGMLSYDSCDALVLPRLAFFAYGALAPLRRHRRQRLEERGAHDVETWKRRKLVNNAEKRQESEKDRKESEKDRDAQVEGVCN